MIIGGFQKNSMIDYPGKIGSVVFTGGCNFHCPYCHNPSLVDGSYGELHESEIFNFLRKRVGLIEGVVLTGGEPTLHRDLPFLCSRIKNMGFSIKLDTNGSKPEIIKKMINSKCVDYFAMDIKTAPENYHTLTNEPDMAEKIISSVNLIIKSGIDYEFRITCAKTFIDKKNIKGILKVLEGSKRVYLQKLVRKKMLDEDYIKNEEDPDLENLKSIIEPYVLDCSIRS
ncbi:MAG: anaerobic ribonucleoside-triphosphate reductase activating protein [Desulfobacterales bacterium]|nr:anaerobic ribonucleoside-triphosphate reductase activating protein [Desulfobacterales bacterium]MCP4159537.1 anaerobic ribonucleoside-triphosphate reductase activating protein [Deltaproteobacteria bacterium]